MLYIVDPEKMWRQSDSLDEARAHAVNKLRYCKDGSKVEIYRLLADGETVDYFGYVSKIKYGSDKPRYIWRANGVWEIDTNGKIKRRM